MRNCKPWLVLFCVALLAPGASAQQRFADLTGPVSVEPVKKTAELEVPFITWGGDVATFLANGGLTTEKGSIYDELGLKLRLSNGDDFVGQVKDYLSGKTPLLRGTLRMLGQASEVLGSDPATKPVVLLQLTWSAGDHVVAREEIKTLNDLKASGGKKRIACQQGGPHVGLLDDMLRAAQLSWDDVEIVWVPDLTGDKGPAELFRKDSTIDACCVISPDMIGLTGGLDAKGSGAEGTVKGAHVLVSTAQMSRSIADVYACRSDWYQANRQTAEKLVAGYLRAAQQLAPMRKAFEESGRMSPEYKRVLSMAQQILGEDVLPTLEVDAHGLLLDCTFVGLPGNISFFQDKGNLNGFDAKLKAALDLAVGQGYATARSGFVPADFDYRSLAELAKIEYVEPKTTGGRITAEAVDLFPDSAGLDDSTIFSFTINFEPNQFEFPADRYGAEFNRAIQSASTFGNAVVAVRGHSDPTKTLVDLIKAGMAKGVIQRSGQRGNYQYFLKTGTRSVPLDLEQTKQVAELVESGAFDGTQPSPRETMQAALNLSQARAEAVKDEIGKYAQQQGVNLDITQVQPVGAGILEPLISKPKNMDEARQNMRVEFRIVKVPAEAISESDFDY